jgi:BNR repeat protein
MVSNATVVVAWQPPAAGCAVTSYLIEAGSQPGRSDIPPVATAGTDRTITLREVADGLYFVRVRAINAAGASEPSNEVRVTIGNSPCGGLPTAPDGLFATVTGRTVLIQWNPSGRSPTSYMVQIGSSQNSSDVLSQWTTTADPSLTVTLGVATYFVRVHARNACGTGPSSSDIVVPTGGRPGQPDVVVVRRSADRNTYFPTVERLRNGHLIVVYYDSPAHVSPQGRISLVKSVDGGRTWSSPIVAIDSPLDDRDPSVVQTDQGTLLLSYFSVGPAGASQVFVARSGDEGATWSVPATVQTALAAQATSAKIIQLEGGALLIPVYGGALGHARSAVVRSIDDGRTWPGGQEVQIASGSNVDLVEPAIVKLGGGHVMAIMRSDRSDKLAMESRSYDGGLTWSEPVKTELRAQGSDLLPVHLGSPEKTSIVHAWGDWSRRFGDSRATLVQLIEFSEPLADPQYGAPHVLYNSHCDDAAYPSTVSLEDGQLFTVYYDACFGYIGGNFHTVDSLRQ